ncbi:DUF4255 domain-containing protein [Pararobbsia silviterrae]|uniref:DUF4255 domain-containing protein n=1 Tax=Pararobbsia silviterrae TaxID=1792498 RepID=A0A494XZN5_9BURK|nr:DUF4255 domain-containing protein [Pararobbsia silviterrae]RKP55977.1 DUF4255 domain-containing protein [Pararobbsia silviterrae]
MSTPSDPSVASDASIISVNVALHSALKDYLSPGIDLTFALPDRDSEFSVPTVSVFLYEIHEDLQMRSGDARKYDSTTHVYAPGTVNVNCNYLITYWETVTSTDSHGPVALPDSQAMMAMNQVVNALVNNRQLKGLPRAYTRMIPPTEELNSLGNFWQSMGNKPRLSINCSITVPLTLTAPAATDTTPAVETTEADFEQIPATS